MKHPGAVSSPTRYKAAVCLEPHAPSLCWPVWRFILYPIVSVVATSLFRDGHFTLEYYQALFTEKNAGLIRNSLFVATLSRATALSFLIALNVYSLRGRGGSLIRSGLLLTMISPPFVSALAYIMLFGRRGIITHQLLGLSINPYGWHGVVILQIIGSISFSTLMLLTAFDHLDARLILASRDLGASPGETLRHVILPLMRPALLSVLLMLFTMNLADFGTPIVIGGSFRVLATEAYLQVISSSNLGRASAISVMMVPAAAAAFYCYSRSMKQEERIRMDGRDSALPTPYTPSRPIAFLARGRHRALLRGDGAEIRYDPALLPLQHCQRHAYVYAEILGRPAPLSVELLWPQPALFRRGGRRGRLSWDSALLLYHPPEACRDARGGVYGLLILSQGPFSAWATWPPSAMSPSISGELWVF